MDIITPRISSALEIIRGIPRGSQNPGPNSDLPHYERNIAFLERDRQIQQAEDRLLKALEDGDDALYDNLINPATGMPYTEAEKREALQNAINREIEDLERNRPISPAGQARLDELRSRLEASTTTPNNSSANSDNKDTTISIADDDDGVRTEHEIFSAEDSLYGNEWGNDNAHASVGVLGYDLNGGAFAEFGTDEVEVGVYGSASANIVSGEAGIEAGPLNGEVAGSIGAQANTEVGVEVDIFEGTATAEAGGEVFVGVEAEVSGGLDAGIAGVEGGVEGKIGVGVEAEADVGFENGEFHIDTEIGLAFGPGVGLDVDVSVDVGEMASGVGDFAGWVGDKLFG